MDWWINMDLIWSKPYGFFSYSFFLASTVVGRVKKSLITFLLALTIYLIVGAIHSYLIVIPEPDNTVIVFGLQKKAFLIAIATRDPALPIAVNKCNINIAIFLISQWNIIILWGTHWKHLIEMLPMSIPQHMFFMNNMNDWKSVFFNWKCCLFCRHIYNLLSGAVGIKSIVC